MRREVTVVEAADRHRAAERQFARARTVEVDDGPLDRVVAAALDQLRGVGETYARVTIVVEEPHE